MYKHILIATDGSDLSNSAVRDGVALAGAVGAKVTAVTVSQPFRWFGPALTATAEAAFRESAQRAAESAISTASAAAKAAGIDCDQIIVENDFPYKGIVDTARARNCDLIVMASHGRSGLSAVILGSETV
jgi:nucleotide-binding universal stress UspA family protein